MKLAKVAGKSENSGIDCAKCFPVRFVVQGAFLYLPQSSAEFLNRFFMVSSYSILAERHYPKPTMARRCLPSPISFSTLVKSSLYGQMWSFCSNIHRARKRSPQNSCNNCAMLGVCSIINLSAVTFIVSLFIQPCAYICYADHGGALYSEPLCFVDNSEHAQFLIDFLLGFIANLGRCGRDPTVEKKDNKVYIRHVGGGYQRLP